MKKEDVFFLFNVLLVCFLLLLSGCTQQSKSKDSIRTILEKANNVGDVYYEVIVTTSTEMEDYINNNTYTMNVWQKMPYMKTETINGVLSQIIIFRPDGSYMYDNQTQNYTKLLPGDNQTQQKFLEEQANEMLKSQTLKVLGKDYLDGKAVTIVEYSYSNLGMTVSPKLWIWNEKGIPLKMEMKYSLMGFNFSMIMEYKNFVFNEIPYSMFDVY